MPVRVTLEGRKPPVWEFSGDTLAELQERFVDFGISFDVLLAESEAVLRFQDAKRGSKSGSSATSGGSALRTAPDIPLGDGGNGGGIPIPEPDAETEDDEETEEGGGKQGPKCVECGNVMDLTPKQAKRLYGRDDICSDCGDAMK